MLVGVLFEGAEAAGQDLEVAHLEGGLLAGSADERSADDSAVVIGRLLVLAHRYALPAETRLKAQGDLVERFQLVTRPDDRRAPDWASKIHVACAPVYYHTYLYGHLVAAQLRATLAGSVGGLVGRRAAGAFLTEHVFQPGESLRWDDLIERAAGEPLSVRHYAAELT